MAGAALVAAAPSITLASSPAPRGPAAATAAESTQVTSARPASEIPVHLPADIVYRRSAGADTVVVFSHATHAAAAENHCTVCHPRTFHLLTRAAPPTHAEMNAGGSCGSCHDGKKSFAVRDPSACSMCHVSLKARAAEALAAASAKGAAVAAASPGRGVPPPHVFPRATDSPGKVTFKHATHRGLAGGCVACHPRLFKMAPEPPRPGGGMHESTACGACHNGTQSFAADDAGSCARCHVEMGGER